MLICGGAMSGYWATGRKAIDSAPASMITMAMTQAKIGRSMKKRDMALRPAAALTRGSGGTRGRRAGGNRAHLGPGLDALQALDDHPVAGLEALGHQPVGTDGLGDLDRAQFGLVLVADHQHGGAAPGIARDALL